MIQKIAKAALLLSLGFVATQCKTPASGSQVKADGDVVDGLEAHDGDAQRRANWAARMGMDLADDQGGARVASVEPAKFAAVIGLAVDDVIVELSGQSVSSAKDFEAKARTLISSKWSGSWVFKVRRGGQDLTVEPNKSFDCDPFMLIGCGPLNASKD